MKRALSTALVSLLLLGTPLAAIAQAESGGSAAGMEQTEKPAKKSKKHHHKHKSKKSKKDTEAQPQ